MYTNKNIELLEYWILRILNIEKLGGEFNKQSWLFNIYIPTILWHTLYES